MNMNDFIRGKLTHQAPSEPPALSDAQLSRIGFYLENGVSYADALEAVRSYQAPPAVNANAGAGTGSKPPAGKLDMNEFIRKAWRR